MRKYAVFAAAAAASLIAFATALALAVDRLVTFALDLFSPANRQLFLETGAPGDGPPHFYHAPNVHDLRHEAGTSKRAAARHI